MNIINQPEVRQGMEALCLTLMHSLWQGLIAAIIAGAILLSTRKSKPALRYNLLALLMLAFVTGTVATFGLVLEHATVPSAGQVMFSKQWVTQAAFSQVPTASVMPTNLLTQITSFFSRNAEMIVAVWLVIFVLKSLQAGIGLFYLHKVTRTVSAPAMHWLVRFYELAERMGVKREVELAESAQVTVPMVVGLLKPIVLVPLGMLASLPASQVEAILLHELAHIRRRDYLINLVQIFCENVFFFNPAVFWISKLIREEREHCCDDLAISVMQNKTSFIHALVSFQEYNQSRPAFEMAFSKKRNHLLDRIKRIVNNNNKPLDAMEKLFVTFSLAAAIALSAATTPDKPAKVRRAALKPQTPAIANVARPQTRETVMPDTLPKKKQQHAETEIHSASVHIAREGISTYNVTRNDHQYEIVQRKGRMISLWVNDQEIEEKDYPKFQAEIDKIMAEVKVQHERAEVQRKQAEEMRKVAELQREEAQQMRLEAEKQREQANLARVEAARQREHADEMRKDAEVHRKQAEEHRKMAEEHRKVAEKEREAFMKIQESIIADLIQSGVVKSKEDLSYRLTNEQLTVNGQKQPAEVHERLKSKYLKNLGDERYELLYNYNGQYGQSRSGVVQPREK